MDLVIGKPSNWAHPAIRLANPISSGIFPALYDWIFEHPVFQRWSQESVNWNLHCVGDPGGGKVQMHNPMTCRDLPSIDHVGCYHSQAFEAPISEPRGHAVRRWRQDSK